MEPSRVELLSRLGINFPIIHRFSSSDPQSKNHHLSLMVGCSGEVFTQQPTRSSYRVHPLGLCLSVFNGVKLESNRNLYVRELSCSKNSSAIESYDVIFRSYIFFEPWIYERRLTLDLHHRIAFANLSKP